jgi:hypothetical protein
MSCLKISFNFFTSVPNVCNLPHLKKALLAVFLLWVFLAFYMKEMMLNKEIKCIFNFRVMHSCLKDWNTLKMEALGYFESSANTYKHTASPPRRTERWGIQIMKLLIVHSSPVSYSLLPVNAVCSNSRKPSGCFLLVTQKPGCTMYKR